GMLVEFGGDNWISLRSDVDGLGNIVAVAHRARNCLTNLGAGAVDCHNHHLARLAANGRITVASCLGERRYNELWKLTLFCIDKVRKHVQRFQASGGLFVSQSVHHHVQAIELRTFVLDAFLPLRSLVAEDPNHHWDGDDSDITYPPKHAFKRCQCHAY